MKARITPTLNTVKKLFTPLPSRKPMQWMSVKNSTTADAVAAGGRPGAMFWTCSPSSRVMNANAPTKASSQLSTPLR